MHAALPLGCLPSLGVRQTAKKCYKWFLLTGEKSSGTWSSLWEIQRKILSLGQPRYPEIDELRSPRKGNTEKWNRHSTLVFPLRHLPGIRD